MMESGYLMVGDVFRLPGEDPTWTVEYVELDRESSRPSEWKTKLTVRGESSHVHEYSLRITSPVIVVE